MKLEARRVLITGASSGLGAAMARSVVRAGGRVAMLARRQERLEALQRELGDHAHAVPCDVVDLEALEAAVDRAAHALGGLDAVVAAAGRSMVGTIATGSPQAWRELFDLNLVGPLATVRFALRHFPASGRRDVIVIGSTGGVTALPGVGIYGASKRGLRAACDTLRYELAPLGIRSTYVAPGMFETEGLVSGMTFDGELPSSDFPMFVGGGPAAPETLTDTIAHMMSLPDGVCVHELVMRPTGQLNP